MNIFKKVTKNKLFFTLLIIFIASICAAPPFTIRQLYIGCDGLYHMMRIEELSKNILNGHIFPYMHSGALGGYGYAGAYFYPELTLIIPAILHIIGFTPLASLSISTVIYNIAAGIISYYCLKIYLNDIFEEGDNKELLALIGALAYIAYPYRLYNIFYRTALNEFIAMCFVPLALLSMYKIFFKKEFKYWKMLSISFSLCLLTHLITTLILGIVGVIFFIINIKLISNKEFIKSVSKAILCSILTTSYFLFPMIEQMLSNEFFYTTLPTLDDVVLYSNQTIEKKAILLVGDSISQPALILLNILLIASMVFLSKKAYKITNNRPLLAIVNAFFIYIYVFVMQTDIFPWKTIVKIFPVVIKIQFPFRFFILGGLVYSLMIILAIPKNNYSTYIKIATMILIIVSPKAIITDRHLDTRSLSIQEINESDNSWYLGFGEYLPSKIEFDYKQYLYKRGNLVNIKYQDGTVESIKRNPEENHASFTIDNSNGNVDYIEMPLIYYKGYDLKNNIANMQIEESSDGFIKVKNIPREKTDIQVYYKGTVVQLISNTITVVFLFYTTLLNKFKKRKEYNKECISN